MATYGSLAFVLHAHLPWVRHPDQPTMMEEEWLYEAITETYLPILGMLDRFAGEQVRAPITMSMTPPLCEMLRDALLLQRYGKRLDALIALAEREHARRAHTEFHDATEHYVRELHATRQTWWRINQDIVGAFAHHQRGGRVDIVTCTATHGLLPLMATPEARFGQIRTACDNYEKHFGRRPRGIWLPECAYAPGVDYALAENGLQYFVSETHTVSFARPRPHFGHLRPIVAPGGVAVFGRDPECSKEVWSADEGYPGDAAYREFYRDLGWEALEEELHPLFGGGPRRDVGIKLHRITGEVPLGDKAPYDPEAARQKAREHARDFTHKRRVQLATLSSDFGFAPLLVAPYDAELFGHWWAEGPTWLEESLRLLAADPDVALTTPERFIDAGHAMEMVGPIASTWGRDGDFSVWVEGANAWLYRELHHAEERFVRLVRWHDRAYGVVRRALNQAARELLLAQSSDWAFIMAMGTTVEYAVNRTRQHLENLHELCAAIDGERVDDARLRELEAVNNVFADIDFRNWCPRPSREGMSEFGTESVNAELPG